MQSEPVTSNQGFVCILVGSLKFDQVWTLDKWLTKAIHKSNYQKEVNPQKDFKELNLYLFNF